jgi:4-amino-4-deoxy-L-arabinose transferase-like glycosyltransferase
MSQPRHALLVLIATTLVVRLVFAWGVEPGVDETYTIATARHLELSYFDHPPAAWWITWAVRTLLHTENGTILRLPFITLFALTTWLMFGLTARLFDEKAGLWAAVALNLAPVLAWTSGTWILPDGPLNAALLAGAICVTKAIGDARSRQPLWWLAAGLCGGLAMMSKYHGAFLFAGVGLFLITSPTHRRWLLTPWPYAGAAVALVVFLPVIVWNEEHGWVSFAFQAERARPQGLALLGPVATLAGQALFLLPWLWLPLIVCLGKAIAGGPADARRWLMACLAIGPIAGFTVVSLGGTHDRYHWAAPGYLMLFPLLGEEIERAIECGRRGVKAWLAGTAVSLVALLLGAVAVARLPWPALALPGGRNVPYPLIETLQWSDLAAALETRGLMGRPKLFIATQRWQEAGKIDYALHGRMPVLCLCHDPHSYGVLTHPENHLGEDALIVGSHLSPAHAEATFGRYFESVERLPSVTIMRAGAPALELSLYLGHVLHSATARPSLLDPLSLRQQR